MRKRTRGAEIQSMLNSNAPQVYGRSAVRVRFSNAYQRGSRRPPPPRPPPLPRPPRPLPPPLPNPPPPNPPPPVGLGRASFTASVRPPSCAWFSSSMAFCASSSFVISTNAKPRARPVAMSRMTRTESTGPTRPNNSSSSASPVSYGRLPTNNLRPTIDFPGAGAPCPGGGALRELARADYPLANHVTREAAQPRLRSSSTQVRL
jgi:hypothetical protein